MLKKAKAEAKAERPRASAAEAGEFAQTILDSSRQIWLAGLGAFSRARGEGLKLFDTLVQQGQSLETRTRRAASDTAAAAAGAAAQKAKEMQAMAGGTWDKLEQVFEDRVARALAKLGVYTQNDVAQLAERVDALSEAVNELIRSGGSPVRVATNKRTAKRSKKRAARATKAAPATETPADSTAKPKRPRAPRKRATRADTPA